MFSRCATLLVWHTSSSTTSSRKYMGEKSFPTYSVVIGFQDYLWCLVGCNTEMVGHTQCRGHSQVNGRFAHHNSYNDTMMESTISNNNNKLIKPIISKMNNWLPQFTSDLWLHLSENEEKKAINADLCIALHPKAMLAATITANNAMKIEESNEVPPTLLNVIR